MDPDRCHAEDYYELPQNVTHRTVSGIEAYRSALTLDWLADEDTRQRELAHVFETEQPKLPKELELEQSECMVRSRPAPGKVSRLMLELLKNIEGDEGVIQELTRTLVRVKLLIETSMLEAEPDLDSLVQTPALMQGEPHATLPRVMVVVWALATDPVAAEASGWCSIKKFSQYLMVASPTEIAARMRAIDPIIARARYILEDFMQTLTPMYNMKRETKHLKPKTKSTRNKYHVLFPSTKPTFNTTYDSIPTRTGTTQTARNYANVVDVDPYVDVDTRKMPNIPNAPPMPDPDPDPIRMKDETGTFQYSNAVRVVPSWYWWCLVLCALVV